MIKYKIFDTAKALVEFVNLHECRVINIQRLDIKNGSQYELFFAVKEQKGGDYYAIY